MNKTLILKNVFAIATSVLVGYLTIQETSFIFGLFCGVVLLLLQTIAIRQIEIQNDLLKFMSVYIEFKLKGKEVKNSNNLETPPTIEHVDKGGNEWEKLI